MCLGWSHSEDSTQRNLTQAAQGTSTSPPHGVRAPEAASTAKATTLCECWWLTTRRVPSGDRAKERGVTPPEGVWPRQRRAPLASSEIAKVATELWRRLEA